MIRSGKCGVLLVDEETAPNTRKRAEELCGPENVPIIDEHHDPRTAFGGRSMGEPATEPGAGAITCAVNMALGKPGYLTSLPFDLDKVFFAGQELFGEEA